jgi:hypothetical protein
MMTTSLLKKNLYKMCWIVAISITAAAILLHFFSVAQAGGLWRDEVGMANIATMSSAKEIFQALLHDHCPMVFPIVVRSWMALGFAHTDAGLRIFGLCVGLALIASFWAASRMMGKGLPMLSLAIVALNPIVIRYGDSMRGYALGMVFILITMGLIWRFIEVPNLLRGLLAGFAAVVSVQTLYQNAFFLLAICVGGIVVCFRQHQKFKAIGVLIIGFVAALSLLPYIKPVHDAQTWWLVSQSGINLAISLNRLSALTGPFLGVWIAMVVLGAAFGISRLFTTAGQENINSQQDLSLFGAIALVLGAIGFGVFIKSTGLPTQVWYYIPVLCFTVVCCDVIFTRAYLAVGIGVLVIAVCALIISPSKYTALRWRQTNGDLVAAQVSKEADAGDFVIVHPWYYGLTFNYYYHGAAKWTTLPPIADYRFHRYDLLKEKLQTPNAIAPVLQQVEATLRSGHRVWIVGGIPVPAADSPAPKEPPIAPHGPLGWSDQPYTDAWGNELGYLLIHHITNVTLLVDPSTNSIPINPMERMLLHVTSGWQTNSP